MVEKLPEVIKRSTLKIGNYEFIVLILDNGKMLIEKESLEKLFEMMKDESLILTQEDMMKIDKAIRC